MVIEDTPDRSTPVSNLGIASKYTVVDVVGELDLVTAAGLRYQVERLISAGRIDIVLDTTETTFIDTRGLSAIVTCSTQARDAGGSLHLHNPQPEVRRLIELSGVDQIVPVLVPEPGPPT